MRIPIYQLDAFTTRRFAGNPAAVMPLERFPDDALLQALAAENNLAETAFLVADGDDYRLRWFTPTVEVPLCGHATLASAAVVMERLAPSRTSVVFHTASGPLTVEGRGDRYAMDFPARPGVAIDTPDALIAALGARPVATLDNGVNLLAVLARAADVRDAAPDLARVAALDRHGVIVTAPGDDTADADAHFVSRYFAPAIGVPEDPVTGSAHCMLAPYWADRLGRTDLRAHQASARGGDLRCRVVGDRVELEGACVFYLEGTVTV